MRDFGIERNASGYADPTACIAMKSTQSEMNRQGIPQPGEVWKNKKGLELLILRTHRGYCNVLILYKRYKGHKVTAEGHEDKFFVPGMMTFMCKRDYGELLFKLPDEQFSQAMNDVRAKMSEILTIGRQTE